MDRSEKTPVTGGRITTPHGGNGGILGAGASTSFGSRMASNRALRVWVVGWLGGSVLGVLNGAARELFYRDLVGDVPAQYISTSTLVALLGLYISMLERRWPIPTRDTALWIGGAWVVLTILFEFAFGHYVVGKSWSELLESYNLADGQVWSLVVVWMGVAPVLSRELHRGKG